MRDKMGYKDSILCLFNQIVCVVYIVLALYAMNISYGYSIASTDCRTMDSLRQNSSVVIRHSTPTTVKVS